MHKYFLKNKQKIKNLERKKKTEYLSSNKMHLKYQVYGRRPH